MDKNDDWQQAMNSVQHSGLAPEQVLEAVKLFQSSHTHLALTQNEFLLLKRLIWDLEHGISEGWHGTDASIKLSIPEVTDLKAIMRKLWYSTRKVELAGTEGTA